MNTPVDGAPGWQLGMHPLLLSTAIATHEAAGVTVNLTWSHEQISVRCRKPSAATIKIPVAVIRALQAREQTLP